MARTSNPLRSFAPAAVLAAATFVLLLAGSPPAYPNDIDLLRFNTQKPYVFILLDTSGSMAQTPQGQWLQGNGDDPRSKLYSAKKVLYEVFSEVDDVHFGFASYNQDEVRAASKHWLYYTEEAAPGGWPLSYPAPDPGGPTQLDADGFAVTSKQGDLLTLGAHFPGSSGRAGACRAPLPWNNNANHNDREKLDRFAKLDSGTGTTVHWLSDASRVYRLVVTRPGNKPDGNPNSALGKDDMHVVFDLARVGKSGNNQLCGVDDDAVLTNDATFDQNYPSHNVKMRLFTEVLIADDPTAPEPIGGFWNSRDLFVQSGCGDPHPHSGGGWEGNYDGVGVSNPNDPVCQTESAPLTCFNLKRPTTIDPAFSTWRAMDRGDLMPFDWRTEKKEELLARLAPGTTESGEPDFGIAGYFEDTVDPVTNSLPLANTNERPLVASGLSPLGKSVSDFRCWFVGEGNKCKDGPFDTNGWEKVAQQNDEMWGCRKPFLIVISDGDDNCPGPNPCSETANLKNKADSPTWVIAYGADCEKAGNPLHCMAHNGGTGDPICPDSPQRLKDTLKAILGQIRQQSRAFASAAVPSVQAIVDDKIFLSTFTPLNDQPIWDGHLNSFLKPLPLSTTTRRPRTDAGAKCTTKPVDQLSECHLWDAGEVLEGMLSPGGGENQRRVFYSRETTSGTWAEARQLFQTTSVATDAAVKHDLWRGLGVAFDAGDTASENAAQTRANAVINETYALKQTTTTIIDPATGNPVSQTVRWVLGDVFHSNPLVVGGPTNTRFFAGNVPGYRDFAEKHRLRRKLVLVGANDGMLHAFDAGIYRDSAHDDQFTNKTIDGEFDNGSGREVFAYVPRAALPAVRQLSEGTEHQWGPDGTVTAADAFIDPLHTGTPDPDRREWRTVLVGGLREGGSAYYALDITQPDTLDGDNVPEPASGSLKYLPSCAALDGGLPAGCGRIPYPAALWEFDDTVLDAVSGERVAFDEDPEDLDADGDLDSNGPDLGDAWSTPNLGRIRLNEGSETVEKHVVIFGGGFDSFNKSAPKRGRWLYMLDVETGKPIYKRRLDSAAPSEPAAVDTDQDGYLDRIYIGTLGGTIYRVDLTADASTGEFPELVAQQARGENGELYDVERVPANVWVPRAIFKTSSPPAGALPAIPGRPIYYRPSVIFVAELGRYALSWGTGNRENLWQKDNQDGRFYVWVDDSADLSDAQLPVTESSLARITVTASATAERFLVAENRPLGARGWYLVLNSEERVITDAFALSGVSFFSTYNPVTCQGTIDPVTGNCNAVNNPLCARGGKSRVFIVNTLNANSFMTEVGTSIPTRFFDVHTFVTNPYTEQGQTKNPAAPGGGTTADDLDERLTNVMESLKQLFPANCKFANYRVDIKTVNADTGVVFIAPVPVCIVEKNWREF